MEKKNKNSNISLNLTIYMLFKVSDHSGTVYMGGGVKFKQILC